MKHSKLLAAILGVSAVEACQRELHESANPSHVHARLLKRQQPAAFPPQLDENEAILSEAIESTNIDSWSYYYTHGLHWAGTNKSMAEWTADRWAEAGFNSSLASYYTYLNYPLSKSLTMTYPNGTVYYPSLAEDVLEEDPTTSYPNRAPTFHGYSWSGNATGELVYVGRGQQVDFERLVELGVPLEGKIALARYGGPFRGLKVKNAQSYGMVGCLIYTDLADDGNVTVANGYAAYPEGYARNPSSVQRGSVEFLSQYPGDPTTPGYPSKEDSPRADTEIVTPRIPSLPLSWRDAQPLIRALDGSGPSGEEINRTNWIGALDAGYYSGPAPGVVMDMSNQMNDTITWIWDSIGIINGTNQDEVLIIGNHRDAWIVGGAADPNSGSAVIIEMARAFEALMSTGWRPKRTIVLCSWDGEEYGLVGSTEWVEEYVPWITTSNVAYLNLDVAVSGSNPGTSATPDLHRIGIDVMKKVVFPYHDLTNVTMYDVWSELGDGSPEVGVLGSGSDYTAFLHNVGISSIDIGSDAGGDDAIYHYHSNYDSYHWMSTFGDPGFRLHKAMAQYITLLAYHFANDEVLPLDPVNYGIEMTRYLADLEDVISTEGADTSLDSLVSAIQSFNASAQALHEYAQSSAPDAVSLFNTKARDYQRGFVSQGGLPTRPYFRHVVVAPGQDTGYAPVTWPGVTEAVQAGNFTLAQSELERAARGVMRAAEILMP